MHFEISCIPPSTNQSLMVANGRLIHSSTARSFKAQTEQALQSQLDQQLRVDPSVGFELINMIGEPLFCHIKFYSNWATKTGTIRKKDLANLEKLLLDSMISVLNTNGYKLDDSAIYLLLMTKHDIDAPENNGTENTKIFFNMLSNFKL